MIQVPIFDRLRVAGYGLFPGHPPGEGLNIRLRPGITMVLGANGLGKTTLITMLYRLLTGPFDIPALMTPGPLGGARTYPVRLSAAKQRVFAERVRDGAENATAELTFKLGNDTLTVERQLRSLRLLRLTINEQALDIHEAGFQDEIVARAGLATFGDWIVLLRYLVFYFEDRRALVWDPSAQRQVLRFLLLDTDVSRQWTSQERAILELDSRARNMSATLYQWEQALEVSEAQIAEAPDIRDQLRLLEEGQAADLIERADLDIRLIELDASRTALRVRQLTAEQSRESAYRQLERLRLLAIGSRFPNQSTTARYLISQLLASGTCLVCGNAAEAAAAAYTARIHQRACVVCGNPLASDQGTELPTVDLEEASDRLRSATEELAASNRALIAAEEDYESAFAAVHTLSASIAVRSREIDVLVRRLPPEEAELHQVRDDLAGLRRQLGELRAELDDRRTRFRDFIAEVNRSIVEWSESITRAFMGFADGFLLEQAELLWSPHRSRVGETGEAIDFPSFQLNLGGADFGSPVRRSGPDEVSESQREFIDLAFRMALMSATTTGGVGSLVIDAPESSLDAVFVSRAADVLAAFGLPTSGNRLVVASNLVEGQLIPQLAQAIPTNEREDRVVDLLLLAAPTAAVREHRAEYDRVRDELLAPQRPPRG